MGKEKKEILQTLALELVKDKTERNLKIVYERMKPGLVNYATNILKDAGEAEWVVTESFVKVWNRLEQYDPFWNFSTWVYKIVYNESLLYMRKHNSNITVSWDDADQGKVNKYLEESGLGRPEQEVLEDESEFAELHDLIISEVYKLNDLYRPIMIDREVNKMKYQEIADKHSMPRRTVATQIKRARKIIKNNIFDSHPELVESYETLNL